MRWYLIVVLICISLTISDQFWVFFGRTDAKAETPILWPLHAKSWLIGKDLDAGRNWGQEEKGTTEDEMAGWHHRLNGHEFEWTPGVGDGQGGLACWIHGVSKSRTQLSNWTELNWWNSAKSSKKILIWNMIKCKSKTLSHKVKYLNMLMFI